jgi:ribosomal protein L37AE/L43A
MYNRDATLFPPRIPEAVKRPAACPFCSGKIIDTLAKVVTVTSLWRCRHCDKTWTIASLAPRRA